MIEYDADAQAAYVRLRSTPRTYRLVSICRGDNAFIDLDGDGNVYGVELLGVQPDDVEVVPLRALQALADYWGSL